MNHVITTYGGGELFTLIFNAIATLFKEGEAGMLMPLIRIGLMVGSVYVVVLMLFKNQLIEGIKWFLWVIIATHLLFLPKTTVWIHDPLSQAENKHNKVDGVPVALGIFAGFVSTVGKTVTESFESVFSLPEDFRYHKTGTVFASSLMSQLGQFRIVDPVFKSNMERFINQCVVYDAMIGHKYTLTELQNEKDIWAFVSSKASPLLGFLYKEDKNPGVIITCKAGAQKLNALWKGEIEKATLTYGSRVQNQTLTKNLFFSHLQNGYELMAGISKSAEDILKQEIMINAIEESSNNKLSELGVPSNYAATKALLQQRSAYAVAGAIAAKTLPLFKNVIEALSYALFIFIVVLALLPNGYKILLTYFGILVWTQLWAPLYAVLNLVMTLYGKTETTSLVGKSGLTLLNSSAIVNANADMVTLAAWLSVSIPFISYGILKQGAGAFVGLAQHLGSAMQSAASSAAAETVSGNISMGNVSMGNQAYQNTSAFQHNTSPTYNASQFKSMGASGVEQSTFADGTQAFNDQAMSHLSVQIMGTENTSFAEQHNLSHARNVAKTMSTAATQATEAALQDSTNFLSRFGSEEFKGEDFSKTLNASQSESLQNFRNHIHDICKKTDWNETQAVEAVIGASIGSPKLLGIGASGNFESSAARQQAIHDANSIATQTGYSENTEKILSAAQAFTEGTRDTTGTELGKSASSSLNTAKSLREEAMVAHNTVDSISKDMSSSQSKGLTISKELTQEVLEFIAHQPTNPGPDGASGGEIGYKEARRIIENGGDERASYLKHFQEAHPQYTIQSINVAGAQSALQTQYETQAQQHRNDAGIQAQHQTHTQDVQHQANAAGLPKASLETRLDQVGSSKESIDQTRSDQESLEQTSLGKTSINQANLSQTSLDQKSAESPQKEEGSTGKTQSIKNFVEQQFADTNKKIEVGHEKIGKKEEPLQTAERASQTKTLGVTAVKNLVVSGGEGVLSVGKDVLTAVEKHPPHEASPYFAGWSQQGLQGEQKQASSMENPGQVTGNSQLATVLQSEPSQTPQTSQTHQAGLSQNQSQNTQEILNQSNGMGVSSHNNASTPSVERAEQGRQTQQTKQETSENQHQQVSMSPSVQQIAGSSQPVAASQGTENSQFAMASQGGSPQILQTPQTSQTAQPHQAVSSQNHAHNTQEILNQGNGMGVSSYNASTPSVERVEQERQSQQTKQGTSGNQQKQLSPKTPIQSVGKSKSSSTSQEGVSQTLQTFKEEGNSSFKNSDSKIAQSDFASYIKPPAIGHQSSEKKGEKPK